MAIREPDAPAAAAADQPPEGAEEQRVLLSLSDDSLHTIFAQLPLPAVAALASTCTHALSISRAENLWQRLVQGRWPGVAAVEDGQQWRALHRERAALPRWQYLWCSMDAVEQLLTERPPAWQAELAEHMIRMGAGPVPHGVAAYDAWAARVRALLPPPALLELRAWLDQLSRGLDVYYDVQEQVAEGARGAQSRALSSALLGALRGLSGLWQLKAGKTFGGQHSGGRGVLGGCDAGGGAVGGDGGGGAGEFDDGGDGDSGGGGVGAGNGGGGGEVGEEEGGEGGGARPVPFHRAWEAMGLPDALRKLEGDLVSLRHEGFQVAVAPSLRPPGTPRSHVWWFYSYTPSGWMGERC